MVTEADPSEGYLERLRVELPRACHAYLVVARSLDQRCLGGLLEPNIRFRAEG